MARPDPLPVDPTASFLQKLLEFLCGETHLLDNGAECPFCYLAMIRYNNPPVRMCKLSKDDMTALLSVFFVADLR